MYKEVENPMNTLFQDLGGLHRRLSRVMDDGFWSPLYWERNLQPPVNIALSGDHAVVTTEVPGVAAEDLDISVQDVNLKVGFKKHANRPENCRVLRQECPTGEFSRTIQLPFRAEEDKIEASLDKGVLTIRLSKAEADKPRRIAVRAA